MTGFFLSSLTVGLGANAVFDGGISIGSGPVLSAFSANTSGLDNFAANVTTDTADGTIYWTSDSTDAVPTQAQIKLGLNEAGDGAADSGSLPVTTSGAKEFSGNSVFLPGFDGVVHVFHERADGAQSAILTSDRFTMPAAAPDEFTSNMWAIGATGNAGQAEITINTLPAANGAAITALEYQIGSGAWNSFGSPTLGTYAVTGFTDNTAQDVQIRAVNSEGASAVSDTKSVTTAVTNSVPSAFTAPDWTIEATGVSGVLRVNVLALPAANGSPIQVIQFSTDTVNFQPIQPGANSTGFYDLTGLTDGVSTDVQLRAVSALGAGPAGDTKSATPIDASATLAVTTTSDGEVQVENAGDGAASITISGGTDYDGTYAVADLTDLADGPLNLVAPVIEDDGTPDVGETLTKRPGLWLYSTDNGAEPTITQQWEADDAGDAVFADISGATGANYTVGAAFAGDDIRLQETAAQGAESRTANSAAVSIPEPVAGPSFARTFIDGANANANNGTAGQYDLTISEAPAGRLIIRVACISNTPVDPGSVTVDGQTVSALMNNGTVDVLSEDVFARGFVGAYAVTTTNPVTSVRLTLSADAADGVAVFVDHISADYTIQEVTTSNVETDPTSHALNTNMTAGDIGFGAFQGRNSTPPDIIDQFTGVAKDGASQIVDTDNLAIAFSQVATATETPRSISIASDAVGEELDREAALFFTIREVA